MSSVVELASHSAAPPLMDPVLRRLCAHHPLDPAEIALVAELPGERARHPMGAELLAEGETGAQPRFLTRGWAACHRTLPDGRRQIFRFVLPGDLIGLEAGRGPPGWSVTALTVLDTVNAQPAVDAALAGKAPGLARAFAMAMRQEERLLLDQVVRIGRMAAYERVADLLLELHQRLMVTGLADTRRFPLPLTQDMLADALGLSTVHVHRVLKQLRQARVLAAERGMVTVLDAAGLARAAGRPETVPAYGARWPA